uniref:YgiT-type zinc finger domain-containing protein n=1 Tax=Candidatus Kentrum sp. LFY TaxID=2126342 RepID=A0A450WHS5_9GAMM|nr:MAG: YgiT-type zinc finger domain-containing protein [Candidatus Kentron sp. LFY]
MKCPACGLAELAHGARDIPYIREGETMIIPDLVGEHCPICGEAVLDVEESMRASRLMLELVEQTEGNGKKKARLKSKPCLAYEPSHAVHS